MPLGEGAGERDGGIRESFPKDLAATSYRRG